MRILWLSPTPSMFDEQKIGGWITSLEAAFRKYASDIELGIAFEYPKKAKNKIDNNITYFPINVDNDIVSNICSKFRFSLHWEKLKPYYLSIIDEYKPDLIECFGSEWEYGKIAKEVAIPVIIHMQGFLNIQNYCIDIVNRGFRYSLFEKIMETRNKHKQRYRNEQEIQVMSINHNFLGRTEWDKNIVRFYNPKAKYFYCNETIREAIYEQRGTWRNVSHKKPVLLTITQGSPVKGNEIILQTALLLKKHFCFDFEWRVAGNVVDIKKYERVVGIKFEDVNVRLLGMIDSSSVCRELQNADIFVNCSINDNSPNSICEAQLIGCPVISSNVGGIPSIVDNGVTGLLYPYNEPHTLAFQLMDLLNNNEKMKLLSKKEIEVASKRHEANQIVLNMINIYKTIIEEEENACNH